MVRIKETPSFKVDHSFFLGMWSSGTRLEDSAVIAGHETLDNDLPEYMVRTSSVCRFFVHSPSHEKCGGAQSRARPSARKRRQQPVAGPSMLTGAQTAKRRKAGSRITAAGTFSGHGQALNADEDEKTTGTGFRKKAVRCVCRAWSLISQWHLPLVQQARS
jgi:hypothetical protein